VQVFAHVRVSLGTRVPGPKQYRAESCCVTWQRLGNGLKGHAAARATAVLDLLRHNTRHGAPILAVATCMPRQPSADGPRAHAHSLFPPPRKASAHAHSSLFSPSSAHSRSLLLVGAHLCMSMSTAYARAWCARLRACLDAHHLLEPSSLPNQSSSALSNAFSSPSVFTVSCAIRLSSPADSPPPPPAPSRDSGVVATGVSDLETRGVSKAAREAHTHRRHVRASLGASYARKHSHKPSGEAGARGC